MLANLIWYPSIAMEVVILVRAGLTGLLNRYPLFYGYIGCDESSIFLRALLPATYAVTLGIWCAALWSAYPEPVQPAETAIERDYAVLAAKTHPVFSRSSARLLRIIRP